MIDILSATISTFERHHELDEQNRAVILEALRAQQERENPKPLTPEQLREMSDEPVWVVCPKAKEYGRWALVEDVSISQKVLYLKNDYTCLGYGSVWIAYRYPPAKEDTP